MSDKYDEIAGELSNIATESFHACLCHNGPTLHLTEFIPRIAAILRESFPVTAPAKDAMELVEGILDAIEENTHEGEYGYRQDAIAVSLPKISALIQSSFEAWASRQSAVEPRDETWQERDRQEWRDECMRLREENLEIDRECSARLIRCYAAEALLASRPDSKTVPMAMLQEASKDWIHYGIRGNSDDDLRAIAARYGYTVEEDK